MAETGMKLVVLDVDGVLTDGRLVYDGQGQPTKRFDVKDGLGIKRLAAAGIEVAIVSGRASLAVERRMADLGVAEVHLGVEDKLPTVEGLAERRGLSLAQVAFVGDDAPDVPCLRAVGLGVAPADGHAEARAVADWVVPRPGGRGVVRAVADRLLADGAAFGVVIPSRYASTRLPGKPLRELAGKPMILHVLERAMRAGARFVVAATDDERIAEVVHGAGGDVALTRPDHPSGMDRVAEVVDARGLGDDAIVVNVQGDEPLIEPALIALAARTLARAPGAGVSSLATPIASVEELFDPNAVKVVLDGEERAIAFSRAPIPWVRDAFAAGERPTQLPTGPRFLRHIGLYAYRVGALRRVCAQAPVPLERAESLEQLRMLWLGIGIQMAVVEEAPARGVDTEADLALAERLLESSRPDER